MAPNVTLHFFAPNDLNGAPLATLTDESPYFKGLKLKMERDGLGGAELVLQRGIDLTAIDADAFNAEVFVRMLLHAYSDTAYYPWGFFFSKRQLTVIHRDEDGGEEFRLGGPGPKQYLSRGVLGIGTPTTGWNLDLANGDWRWGDSATVGQILGQIIGQDASEDDPALPDLTRNFNASTDSAGVAWADTDLSGAANQYRIPIGTSLLQSLWDLDDLVELTSWIELGTDGAPEFQLNVIQGLGEDVTGSAFGAGVCLLREGDNIADDALTADGISLKKASHVIVQGSDGAWAEAVRPSFTPGDYVKRVKIEYSRSNSAIWLEKAGIRWLQRQDYGEKELSVEILPGADDASGLYFPAPDRVLWLSNLISLDSSADGSTHGHLDYQPSEDQLVTGFELELGPAGDTADATAKARSWDVTVKLNIERPGNVEGTPSQGTTTNGGGGGGGGGNHPLLCRLGTEDIAPVDESTTLLKFYDANDGGDSIGWTGILANQGGGAEGSSFHYFKSTAPEQWQNLLAATAGVHYRITGYKGDDSTGERLKFGFFTSGVGSPGNYGANGISQHTLADGGGPGWNLFVVDLIAPAGTNAMGLGRDGGGVNFDRVRIYTVDTEAEPGIEGDPGDCPEDVALECDPGTGSKAARCDHVHAHGNLSDDELHHHNASDIEGGTAFPSLLTSTKASADTPDDDFPGTGLDGKWTAADGTASTITLLKATGAGIYQVGLIDSWLHMLLGTANGDSVDLRQDYTLPDGACLVAALFIGPDNAGASGGIANNEFQVGIGVNSTDSAHDAGTFFYCAFDAQASANVRVLSFDGTTVFGQAPDSPAYSRALFVRIDRVGLVYHAFWAPLTMGYPAWEYLGSKTLGAAANNIWLFGQCGATAANRINVGVPWFRQGTALAVKPW